jgi:hypothetical protein
LRRAPPLPATSANCSDLMANKLFPKAPSTCGVP